MEWHVRARQERIGADGHVALRRGPVRQVRQVRNGKVRSGIARLGWVWQAVDVTA